MKSIPEIVNDTRADYKRANPFLWLDGWMPEGFAFELDRRLRAEGYEPEVEDSKDDPEIDVVHFWVTVDGRHYDAQAPDGVDCYGDLPAFKALKSLPVDDE